MNDTGSFQQILDAIQRVETVQQTDHVLLEGIANKMGRVEKEISDIKEEMGQMKDRMDSVEDKIGNMEGRMENMEVSFGNMEERMGSFERELVALATQINELGESLQELATHMDERFTTVDVRLTRVESSMITKSYLDDRLADLRGDLVLLARKGNDKLVAAINELVNAGSLKPAAARAICDMQPFPMG
jgi:chromosome segregation ATPase